MSKAIQYADSDEAKIQSAKRQIAYILKQRYGKDQAISSQGLAQATGLKATTVRDLIKEIRANQALPIVACSKGYYLIKSTDQLEREIRQINDEIQTREETKQELTRAFNIQKYD